jgi:hypothetical protein
LGGTGSFLILIFGIACCPLQYLSSNVHDCAIIWEAVVCVSSLTGIIFTYWSAELLHQCPPSCTNQPMLVVVSCSHKAMPSNWGTIGGLQRGGPHIHCHCE